MKIPAVYAVVLAAGSGTRFGGDKLAAKLHGRPLIAHVATSVAEAIANGTLAGGFAVLRPGDTALAWHLDTAGLQLVTNPDAKLGLGSSLRAGLRAAGQADPPAGAALVVLGDQPLVRPEVITRLVEHWGKTGLSARPRYAGRPADPGHPVLLDRSLWPLAEGLEGDAGLGTLLRARPDAVATLDVSGENPSVETIDDLLRLEDLG
jgi:CTP:molybdopterin cytidylyltransferase MocA